MTNLSRPEALVLWLYSYRYRYAVIQYIYMYELYIYRYVYRDKRNMCGYIGVYMDYIGITEKDMETTFWRFRVFCVRTSLHSPVICLGVVCVLL